MHLHTSRLLLRPWKEDDYPTLATYFADIDNTRFLGGTKTREQSWRLMATYLGHLHLRGYSYLAFEENESGRLVGSAGLWNSEPWPEVELGYWLLPEGQGKGYATEAAGSLKDHAFQQLNLNTLVSYIVPENLASIKVAERLGGRYDGEVDLLDFGPHGVYRYSGNG